MSDLELAIKEYNHWVKRNNKAEEYFSMHEAEYCLKYLNEFHEVTAGMSLCRTKLEKLLGRKLTTYEIFNGL